MMTFKGPLHMFFVYNTLMHDLGIDNIFTNSITKKVFIQIIEVKKRLVEKISIIYVSFPFFREDFPMSICLFAHFYMDKDIF